MSSENSFAPVSNGSKFVLSSNNHPRLPETGASSIHDFLQTNDQYATRSMEHVKQLSTNDIVSTKISRPVNLKFFVNAEGFKSLIAFKFLSYILRYYDLTDEHVQNTLHHKSIGSKVVVTLDFLDGLFAMELRMNMAHSNARSRTENLFVSSHMIRCRIILFWLLPDNQNAAAQDNLSVLRPDALRSCLESNLDFSHIYICKEN